MKVYAELFSEEGIEYRTKTLLQYGNSWNLIGSIVMKNPGSASPIEKIKPEVWDEITKNQLVQNSNADNWFEFSPDSTMRQVEKIFNGSYLENPFELNGVVQVFNLFNIRHKDINEAKKLEKISKSSHLYPNTEETISAFKSKPVFLGCRWEYLNVNKSFAEAVFEYVKNSKYMYLKGDMIDNHFYHPGYLNRSYKRADIQETLKLFINCYK